MTSILDPGFCCKKMKAHLAWGGSLCLQHFYTASCEHSHSYTAFYKASHPYTASYKAGWSDNMLYTFHVTRNSQHHTGRCQSSVEWQKRGSRVAISMSNVHASSFVFPQPPFQMYCCSHRGHTVVISMSRTLLLILTVRVNVFVGFFAPG